MKVYRAQFDDSFPDDGPIIFAPFDDFRQRGDIVQVDADPADAERIPEPTEMRVTDNCGLYLGHTADGYKPIGYAWAVAPFRSRRIDHV